MCVFKLTLVRIRTILYEGHILELLPTAAALNPILMNFLGKTGL